jgi:predicted transcriptional regulator
MIKEFNDMLDAFFGCSHKHYSFPITTRPGQRRSEAASVTGTYVVCLDCGKEFAYDWQEMKFVSSAHKPEGIEEAAAPYAKSA